MDDMTFCFTLLMPARSPFLNYIQLLSPPFLLYASPILSSLLSRFVLHPFSTLMLFFVLLPSPPLSSTHDCDIIDGTDVMDIAYSDLLLSFEKKFKVSGLLPINAQFDSMIGFDFMA